MMGGSLGRTRIGAALREQGALILCLDRGERPTHPEARPATARRTTFLPIYGHSERLTDWGISDRC